MKITTPQIAVCSECQAWVMVRPEGAKGVLFFRCPRCLERVPASSWWPAPTPKIPEVRVWTPVLLERVVTV